ncbi:recombinase family protein [Mucilaginibacter sp. ZT4R22]|uniref:Recombinase family protein n=1 Tax=Mucilaginibacter pankratovii TaxID=2772110 RepID=A0ABR7WMF7_9SPHI|nr:recombinase family protein [Mucilaginibacter pankratovii]MBD1363475.1 recombinase family protein [Mucilaginibacter pankratovii]
MKTEKIDVITYGEYLRKSTDDKEKQTLSLGNQRDVLDRLRNAHNLTVVETIEEKMSAKKPGRFGFGILVNMVKDGKINGIITWAPHRLSRNSVDTGELIDLFDRGLLKEIVTDGHVYRNNPMDKFMFGFNCLQAKFENDNKAIDVKNGMLKSASLNMYPACPPIGYFPDKHGIRGARKRDVDAERFPVVERMWKLLFAGTHTPYQILSKATNEWGLRSRNNKKLTKSSIYKIFHNPFYYGEFEFPKGSGNWFKGNHKPMITKAQFDRAQEILSAPERPRPITHYFAFGGCMLHCSECGCAITGMAKTKKQKNGNVHHYIYYGCTKRRGACKQMPVTENELNDNIYQILVNINIPKPLHDLVLTWISKENEKHFIGTNAQLDAYKNKYSLLQKKIEGLIDMRAAALINDTEYQSRRLQMESEKAELLQLTQNLETNKNGWLDKVNGALSITELVALRFQNGNSEDKRGILAELGWNLSISQKQLDLTRENWIWPVIQIAMHIKSIYPTSEPVLSPYFKAKIENLLNSEKLCSLLDDVRNLFSEM